MTSVAACQTAIQAGPFIIGINWYTSFDSPDGNGLVSIAAGATVRGGHEVECIGYDAQTDLWELVNSWGTGYGVAGHFFFSSATFTQLLAEQGDATQFVPLSQPAPTPTPTPNPVPTPVPGPTDVDAAYFAANHAWALKRHLAGNKTAAENFLQWATKKGYSTTGHEPEHLQH
jgi:hypothetical protein